MKIDKFLFNIPTLLVIFSAAFICCQPNGHSEAGHSAEKKSFLLTGTDKNSQNTTFLSVSDLVSDSLPDKAKVSINKKWINEQWVINRGNEFYYIDPESKKLIKLQFINGRPDQADQLSFSLFSRINWYQWVNDNTLLIGGNGHVNTTQDYALIDTRTMTLIKSGVFQLPAIPNGMQFHSCSGLIRDDKFFLGYSIIDPSGSSKGKYANDTAYLAVMDFPSFRPVAASKDTRSTFPGSGRAGNGGSFTFNGDIYILSSPVDWNGQNYSKPTGFFRIKKGEYSFDKDYFFNVSKLLNDDDPDALIYLGDGKAIVRSAQHKYVKEWSDWSKEITQYVVLDVVKQTAKLLDLPLFVICAGGLATDGIAYLPVVTKADGIRIYSYDAATEKLEKGIKVGELEKFGKIYSIK